MSHTPAEVAALDQATAECVTALNALTKAAQALLMEPGTQPEQAIADLSVILTCRFGAHPRVLAGLLATALVRATARHPGTTYRTQEEGMSW